VRIWIDLANSPHPLLFAPVARAFERNGHDVLVTSRDNAQTVPLAQARWPNVEVIGGASPKAKPAKLAQIGRRAHDLRRWAERRRPDVALSHNSYAQVAAARSLRIPAVTMMDFEGQPANHVAFRLANVVLLPAVLPLESVRWQGATACKVIRYPGLKEELYVGDFEPNPAVVPSLGIDPRPSVVIVARTPPSRAVYYHSGGASFVSALRAACAREDLVCVVLPRYPEEAAAIEGLGIRNCRVATRVVDSRSLLYAADAMLGGGGTMTREAALMGIPTWSLFAGRRPPTVDQHLEQRGLLRRLTSVETLWELGPRQTPPRSLAELRSGAEAIERIVTDATLALAGGG
jgi:predicted glycosyltransferase